MRIESSVEFSGDDLVAAVTEAIQKGLAGVVGPIMQEAEEIRGVSMEIVPVDEGDLRSSALEVGIDVEQTSGEVKVTFGYGGPGIGYAVVQHENPEFRHTDGRSWKYLEGPAYEAAQTMGGRLAARIGGAFEGRGSGGGPVPGATFGGTEE